MLSAKAVIVVAPAYPPELIKELLSARILPLYLDLAVLLPPERSGEYDLVMQGQKFFGVRFLRSPGRKFFSTSHLSWLRGEMRSKTVLLLIPKSPFQDLTSALVSLIILLWSWKKITLLHKVTVKKTSKTDENYQDIDKVWVITEINKQSITEEIRGRIIVSLYPLYPGDPEKPWKQWEILYLLMFVGLILRQSSSVAFATLVHKLRGK